MHLGLENAQLKKRWPSQLRLKPDLASKKTLKNIKEMNAERRP
jgi:hypothetical protein